MVFEVPQRILKLVGAYHVCYICVALSVHLHAFLLGGMSQ